MSHAFTKNSFAIGRCESCGLGRTLLTTEFDPSRYYVESYFQGAVADGYADYVGSADTLRAEFRHALKQILPFCRGGRLLEFGCAYGFFLEEAKPYFDSVHGIEYADAAAQACRDRGLDVVAGPVSEATLIGVYDAAVGLDVIEHVRDPYDTVRLISTHLSPGGVLVMTTGDWAAIVSRITGPQWRLMTPPQHLWFFTPASIRKLLESVGLKVVSLTHPWKRVPLSLVAYQLQRMIGVNPRALPLLTGLAVPMNLGDAMRVISVKQ